MPQSIDELLGLPPDHPATDLQPKSIDEMLGLGPVGPPLPPRTPSLLERVQSVTKPASDWYRSNVGEPLEKGIAGISATLNPENYFDTSRADPLTQILRGEAPTPNAFDKFIAGAGPVDLPRAGAWAGGGAAGAALRAVPGLAGAVATGNRVVPALTRSLGIGAGQGAGELAAGATPEEAFRGGAGAASTSLGTEGASALASKGARSFMFAKGALANRRANDIAEGFRGLSPGLSAVGKGEGTSGAMALKQFGGPEGKAALQQAKEQATQAAEKSLSDTVQARRGITQVPSEIALWYETPQPGQSISPGRWGPSGQREVTLREANDRLTDLYEKAYGQPVWERGPETRQAQMDYRDLSARIETAMGHGGVFNVPTPEAAGLFRQGQNAYKAGRAIGDLTNEQTLYRQFPSGEEFQSDQLARLMQQPAIRSELIAHWGGLRGGVEKYNEMLQRVLLGQKSGAGAVPQGAGRPMDAPMDFVRGSRGAGMYVTTLPRIPFPALGQQYPGRQPLSATPSMQMILDLLASYGALGPRQRPK